jgi:predicted lipid-binding transport protein (Tim44 family)
MAKRYLSALRASLSRIHWRAAAIALLCAWIALAPSLAEARAGSSSSGRSFSQGSRGSRTFEGNGAAPMDRSMTARPAPSPSAPSPGYSTPYNTPAYGGGFMQRNPFMTGLLGGFLGAGLAGMIFGHGAWAADGSAGGSMLGMLMQFALIAGLIWLAVSFFRRRSSGMAVAPAGYAGSVGGVRAPAAARNPVEINITDADFTAWGALLTAIQDAWSRGDLAAMRRYVTPEMLSYFSEQLSANASQGVENRIENVNLLKGDLQEAWSEGDLEYATARLHWSANDYMVSSGAQPGGQAVIVSGDPSGPVEATELWTFVRGSNGGRWLLSAIQQV